METDFLNFHDEEHFSTALYQHDILDDSQGSILDIVGNGYSRTESNEYWEHDVEQELNGDVAVIPMSGQINHFPKLSNSPPTKDFQRIFSDWQQLSSIETASSDDLTVDLQLSSQSLVVDMFDCFTPSTITTTTKPIATELSATPTTPPATPSIISTLDFSNTPIPTLEKPIPQSINTKTPARSMGGKNLDLLKQVVKENINLDTSFKSYLTSADELDLANDNFDITRYVNAEADPILFQGDDEPEVSDFGEIITPEVKDEHKEEVIKIQEDSEEDCVDVETVSEQMPVLQARDLTSLLEQFEASEAVNPPIPQTLFDTCSQPPDTPKSTSPPTEPKQKIKQLNSELKQPTNKQKTTVSVELLEKIRASSIRKSVSVIPARPSKKLRVHQQINRNKSVKTALPQTGSDAVHFDHDYCAISPPRLPSATDTNLRQPASLNNLIITNCDTKNCDNDDNTNKYKKNIDDTALRIGKQIKNAINNENKQKMARKQLPTVKNNDGKLMISLLKTNNRNLVTKSGNTIVNTINTQDEQIQNIIISDSNEKNAKKRKLNLEEYKKLRGDLKKANDSVRSSGHSSLSPPQTEKVEYQELIMKMASEILKTNAKQKQTIVKTKLDKFVPPDAQKQLKNDKTEVEQQVEVEPAPKIQKDYEMKTIVSIGVNTDETNGFKPLSKKTIEPNHVFESNSGEIPDNISQNQSKSKINELLTPFLQNASPKINSNSLITNITATLLQNPPKTIFNIPETEPREHGEDKTVIILDKNEEKPPTKTIGIQTDVQEPEIMKDKAQKRNYRSRRDSSASSSASSTSLMNKSTSVSGKKGLSYKQSVRNSSSNSISSSVESHWSRSRSRSRSSSNSEYSSYTSDSSRSKSRSVSPIRRWHSDRDSRSRSKHQRYNRSRKRSRSSSYKGNYRHSRSPCSRSRSRRRRERESAERERIREVEERRVIYVGKISDDTTRNDLRRRFQNFGRITNVSVHFRDHGDNYGFVTFAYKMDAYEAVERGNDDPNVPKYDISFGGRRAFCKTRYSDLDNIEGESMNPVPIFRREEDTFDILLREVQAKLRKRKV